MALFMHWFMLTHDIILKFHMTSSFLVESFERQNPQSLHLARFAEAAMYSALFSQGKPVSAIERRDRLMFQVTVSLRSVPERSIKIVRGLGTASSAHSFEK